MPITMAMFMPAAHTLRSEQYFHTAQDSKQILKFKPEVKSSTANNPDILTWNITVFETNIYWNIFDLNCTVTVLAGGT